ncbi:MAG TPA: RDD family protein [Chthoniobacterales bacterium]|nr:RDD family protein [Chthoniobacterales bacterium]
MSEDPLQYAGFGVRFLANLLDFVFFLPLLALTTWASSNFRLFGVYYISPGTLFGLFYHVYLVQRYGGTPGKLIAGIRIRRLDGETTGYREAVLRYLPDAVLGVLAAVAMILPRLQVSDAEYKSLPFREVNRRMIQLAPAWATPLRWITHTWVLSELVVLLTNHNDVRSTIS